MNDFEQWVLTKINEDGSVYPFVDNPMLFDKYDNGSYRSWGLDLAYKAWTASRDKINNDLWIAKHSAALLVNSKEDQ